LGNTYLIPRVHAERDALEVAPALAELVRAVETPRARPPRFAPVKTAAAGVRPQNGDDVLKRFVLVRRRVFVVVICVPHEVLDVYVHARSRREPVRGG